MSIPANSRVAASKQFDPGYTTTYHSTLGKLDCGVSALFDSTIMAHINNALGPGYGLVIILGRRLQSDALTGLHLHVSGLFHGHMDLRNTAEF
jgi:hypothetical protein